MILKNFIHNFCLSLVTCVSLLLSMSSLHAQTLSGRVTIAGTDNSALATIRIVDLGIGTTSRLDGSYYLEGIKPGQHTVEYSYIGHKTVRQTITWNGAEAKEQDVVMEEAPIMLTAAFVTPNGEDAAQYILKRVWSNAEQKRSKMSPFQAQTSTVISYSDFDVIDILPGAIRTTIMGVAWIMGLKKIVKLLVNHPEMNVSTSARVSYQNKKFKWDNFAIARCSEPLTDEEKKTLFKLTDEEDLYNLVYGDENKFRSKKTKTTLKGSYEDGDKLVYVLEGTTKDGRCEMHVVEDTWDVLKVSFSDSFETLQIECRKAPGGLYLPISVNRKLSMIDQTPEELEKKFEEYKNDEKNAEKAKKAEKKVEKMKKKIDKDPKKKKHLEEYVERVKARGIHIVVNAGLSVNYAK